ncbi:protein STRICTOSIDINE SYNTHASE-LIKE 10-like [Phragmites australis]|uniref:protein STRICTOSIDINE SYNTHASE-LIKE 10-like n=1 Tax=Phragmites australis TaxID=29695 RepID=UPI002D76BCF2|nr:protein STRICTOSIDINE SYNTHASE-LIKE 10-like [Phragmites australis]
MGRNLATSLLLVVGLAVLLPSFCAADSFKTTPMLWSFHLPLPDGVSGAESLAFDRRGQGPYAGVSDGRVLKWGGSALGWTTFAHNANYSTERSRYARRPDGGEAAVLATQADGVLFHFVNGL